MKHLVVLLLLAATLLAQEKPRVWVHAPAADLLGLFPGKGAGFLISIDEYNRLLDLAEATRARDTERPPLDARIVRGSVRGRIVKERLLLDAEYVVVVQGSSAAELPFGVAGIALTDVQVDEGGAYMGGVLRFAKAGTYRVKATFAKRLDKSGRDLRRVAFLLPSAAAHSVDLTLPARMEGEVGPIVRAFATGPNGGSVTGYPDRKGLFRFWMRPRTRARKLDPLVSSTFAVMASVGETRTLASTRIELEVLRAPLARTVIELPKGQLVHALQGAGIKTWKLVRAEPRDRLEIEFVKPVEKGITLTLETELPRDNPGVANLPFPRVPGAVRYRGTVGLVARPEVRLTAIEASGARRLDKLPKQGIALFEVFSPTAELKTTVEAIASKTRAETIALLRLGEGGQSLLANVVYRIAGKPLFRLVPRLPAGWTLRGEVLLDGAAIPHRLEKDGQLILEFANGLNPGVHVLQLRLDTDRVDWVPESGKATFTFAGIAAGLPEQSGKLAVAADSAFRVGVAKLTGLRSIGLNELGIPVGEETLFAWSFDNTAIGVTFDIERNRTQLTATVIHRVVPRETMIKVHTTVALRIERAGIRELKIALPKGTGRTVDFRGAFIKERQPPDDGADPEVWTLKFQRRLRGFYRLDVVFDKTFKEDSWKSDVPTLALPGASESGFLVIGSSDTSALKVDRGGLREADVAELPEQPGYSPLEVLAYAKQPFTVKIDSQRHDPHSVVQAIALSAHIYGVVSSDGRLRCRAEYRVRNNDQPFLLCGLPKGSRLIGALVDGEPIKPLLAGGWLKLPLARSKGRETPFVVAVVYETKVDAFDDKAEVRVARPVLDIDVLKTTYTLHLPDGYTLTGHDGDMVPLETRERETVLGDLARMFAWAGGAAGDSVDALVYAPDTQGATYVGDTFGEEVIVIDEVTADGPTTPATEPSADPARQPKATEAFARDSKSRTAYKQALKRQANEHKNKDSLLRKNIPAEKGELRKLREQLQSETAKYEEDSDMEAADKRPAGKPRAPARREKKSKGPWQQARGGDETPPEPDADGPARAQARKRPERALLSLDVQFLKSDNVVRLESLAPTGGVTLSIARHEVFTVRHYLGAVIGLAAAILLLLASRVSLLRLLPATALFMVGLHFAGLSFLSGDFARGAGWALTLTLFVALLIRMPRLVSAVFGLARRIRWPRRPAAGASALLLAAGLAQAGEPEEILVPYKGDDYTKIEQVFLEATRYHELRKLAYPDSTERQTVVGAASYEAVRLKDEVAVRASYRIVKSTDASERLALRLQGVAVTQAKLNGKPAALAVDTKRGYSVMLAGKGEYELVLTLRPRLQTRAGTQWISLPVRPVATARMRLEDDSKGYEVVVGALGGETEGVHNVGPVSTLNIIWKPKTEGPKTQVAELRAQTDVACSVRDGFTAVGAFVRFGISGGSTSRVRVMVDKSLTVRSVGTKYLAGWERGDDGVVTVLLSRPHTREAAIGIVAERTTQREREESAPLIQPLDVLRDAGTITLETLPDLKLELLATQGLMRGKAPKKAPAWRGTPEWGTVHSAYRYAVRPFELRWRVKVEATRFRARSQTWISLRKELIAADVRLEVEVERGPGLFELLVGVPEGYEVLGASGPHVRDWWVETGKLHIALLRRHRQRATYAVRLRRRVETADGVDAPALTLLGAVRQPGIVRVLVADGLEVETGESDGLLPTNLGSAAKATRGGFRAIRAYRHVAVPWSLRLSTREERREVDAFTVTRIVPLSDRVRVEALLNFHVRRGLVDEVSFDVPVAEEKDIVIVAPEKREAKSVPIDGGRRYTLSLRNATRGSVAVTVSYQVPYGTTVRGVEPRSVSQLRRFVVVEKIADGEVRMTRSEALESTDFGDLPLIPPGSSATTAAACYVGTGDPFALDVTVKTHSFEEVARALVYSAAAQVVVDRSGWTRTLISYRVYNRSRQFLILRLPDGARLYSVLVAGKGVRPLMQGGRVLVPLRKVAIGATAFDVDVVYAYGAKPLDKQEFKAKLARVEGIDVRRTTVSLYLPTGFRYSFDTEMDEIEASSITVGQATDRYEEIKELYGVAERGNRLQAQRALDNVAVLEREQQRVAEQVEAQSSNDLQIKQIESQNRALSALRRTRGDLEKRVAFVTAPQQASNAAPNDTTAIFGLLTEGRGQAVESWKVNPTYMDRNKLANNDDLKEFDAANMRGRGLAAGLAFRIDKSRADRPDSGGGAWRGPSGGVPPGLREPTDASSPPPPPGGGGREATIYVAGDVAKRQSVRVQFSDSLNTFGYSPEDGGDAGIVRLYHTEAEGRTTPMTLEAVLFGVNTGGATARVPLAQLDDITSGLDDNAMAAIGNAGPGILTNATGRISLRIDLPKDGEVYHFASTGDRAAITVDASESSSAWWQALLAVLFLSLGALVLRVGGR